MAVTHWLRLALGGEPPKRYPVPKAPPVILIAPNRRAAELWCYEHQIHPRSRDVQIVTSSRYGPDRLRGIAPGRDIVWVHGPPWNHLDLEALENRVAYIRATVGLNSERHVYV